MEQNTNTTKYRCNKIQMQQNTNRTKCKNFRIQTRQNTNVTRYKCNKIQIEQKKKIPKYKHDKIQKDKILVFREPPHSRPPPFMHLFSIGTPSILFLLYFGVVVF